MKPLPMAEEPRGAEFPAPPTRYNKGADIFPAPPRINGHRRYDARVFDRLAIIQMAQQAGFTVSEIRVLFNGFAADTPAAERWQALARQKLVEVDAILLRTQVMKQLLEEKLLRCRCLTLDDCARCIHEQ